MLVLFFGRTTNIFANTFARGFGLVLRVGARAFRRQFWRVLRRVFACLLRQCSDYALPRYYFDLLMFFAVCLLDIYLLMTDVRSWVG